MMSSNSLMVSIIVPNYNYANYLDQRINSILNQTYQSYEIIILDDASTDDSLKVIERYRNHPKVSHVIINEENTGKPFMQWMKGITLARGEWIWIAEADDLALPQFLETCMKYIQMDQHASVCYVDNLYIDQNDRPLPFKYQQYSSKATIYHGPQFAQNCLYWENIIANASGVVFRKQFALNIKNQVFYKMRYCGDWMFWFEMALQGNVISIHEKLNHFRQHLSQTAKGKNNGQNFVESLKIIQYIETIFPQINNYKRKQCYGRMSRYIRHIKNQHVKENLKEVYRQELHSSLLFNYYFFKLHRHFRFIPWIMTEEKDHEKAVVTHII